MIVQEIFREIIDEGTLDRMVIRSAKLHTGSPLFPSFREYRDDAKKQAQRYRDMISKESKENKTSNFTDIFATIIVIGREPFIDVTFSVRS